MKKKKKKIQIRSGGAEGLLELAKWAEKHNVKGPKDLSKNHDKYIWGK